jgi:glycosyltransferase involved in cell wall biosynthesis
MSTRIRVLHVCNQLDLGGTEKALQIFCKYLDKERFEVYACGRVRGGARVPLLEKLGIPVIIAPRSVTDLVRELKIDIYHVHRAGDSEPGSLPEHHQGKPRIVETNVFNAFDAQESARIDCHFFVSDYSKRYYESHYPVTSPARCEVLYNPIDFEEFTQPHRPFSATFGRCSRADDQKWHDVCVKSLPKIFRKVPEARYLVQGITPRVRARIEQLGCEDRVEVLEPTPDVSDFYSRVDVFTHGARVGETFGSVIAEAMASRVPVVTLSTPQRGKSNAQAELVEHNITGYVCRWQWQYPGAVIELLQNHDLRRRFAERGYDKAREKFDAARLAVQLGRVYTELMDGAARSH